MKKKLVVMVLSVVMLLGAITVSAADSDDTIVLNADNNYTLNLEIHLVGDVDGNGSVTVADVNVVNRSLLSESHPAHMAITDSYDFLVADIDESETVTIADVNLINRSLLPSTHPAYLPLN